MGRWVEERWVLKYYHISGWGRAGAYGNSRYCSGRADFI